MDAFSLLWVNSIQDSKEGLRPHKLFIETVQEMVATDTNTTEWAGKRLLHLLTTSVVIRVL